MIDPALDLANQSLDDLKQIAQDEDLDGRSKLTRKADLLAALEDLQRKQAADLTKEDLLQAAREEDIEGRSKMDKAELVEALVGPEPETATRIFGVDDETSVPHLLSILNRLRAREIDGRYVEADQVAVRLDVRRQITAENVLAVARSTEYVKVKGTTMALTDDGLIAARGRMTPRRLVAGVA